MQRLCESRIITAVNGKFPGPTIHAHEGDTVIVHVINNSPYNMTIHWYNFASIKFVCVTSLIIYTIDSIYNKIMLNRHGIFQLLSGWADGPDMITQCPVVPGNRYTHKFNITGQEGTLWWHSHISILRATVYGALIIRPRSGTHGYPFPKPYKEVPIMIGTYSRISKFLYRFKLLPP